MKRKHEGKLNIKKKIYITLLILFALLLIFGTSSLLKWYIANRNVNEENKEIERS